MFRIIFTLLFLSFSMLTYASQNVVLLHGLFASKNQWDKWVPLLTQKGYHVVVPELPEKDYSLEYQVKLLHQLMVKLHLHKINLAGNSMGGMIAALYAKSYPSEVVSLAFIGAPLGIHSPILSPVDNLIKAGHNPFIPLTKDELNQELQLLFVHPPELSEEIINTILTKYKNNQAEDLKIWEVVQKHSGDFDAVFNFPMPTLIIWGDQDHVFDVSAAPLLQKNIPGSQLEIVKGGSHLLFMEEPEAIVDIYVKFLSKFN